MLTQSKKLLNAVKKLYTKVTGGKTTKSNDLSTVIDSMAENYQGGGSENHLYNVSGEFFVWTTDDKSSRFYIDALSTDGSSVIISDSISYAEFYAFMQTLTNIKVNLNTDSKVNDDENIYEVWLEIADNNIKINYSYINDERERISSYLTINSTNFSLFDGDAKDFVKTQIF